MPAWMAGAFLLLQGLTEMLRCLVCLQRGQWPSRDQDVQENDVSKLRELVHADADRGA